MGKNASQKAEVTEYRMSIHFGVALSFDAITGIWVNEKEAWNGTSSTLEAIEVNKPDLFGGNQKEGGLGGMIVHLPGRDDQVMPEYLAARMGLTAATCPAYRGVTSLFFVGGGSSNPRQQADIPDFFFRHVTLEQAADGGMGFIWSHNNPVIAQSIWIRGTCAPITQLDQDFKMIGVDANPAHIVYECLTDDDFGMGHPTSSVDHAAFEAASQTLYDELFGLSLPWTGQLEIRDFISEVLDHVQGFYYLDPESGLHTIKLMRDDYDVGDLFELNPDNCWLTNYSTKGEGETANECTVSWTNPENEQTETVTYQDLGSIAAAGRVIPNSRQYYGVRNRALAGKLAQRDCRSAAAPLATATATVNRQIWFAKPGMCVLLTWPEYGVQSKIMRVMQVDYGDGKDSSIKLSLLEDIFSLEKPPAYIPPGTGWEESGSPPEPMAATEIITLPSYMTASADFQTTAIDVVYPEVLAMVLGYQDRPDAYTFDLLSNDVTNAGEQFVSHGTKTIIERTVLPAAMLAEVESRFDDGLVINKQRGPEVGGFMLIGAGSDFQIEIALVTGYDEVEDEWILARGVLDTVPDFHPIGTPVWFVNPGDRIVDDRMIRSAGEEVEFKLLTRSSLGILPVADAPTVTETLTDRPHRPLRPANVEVNGLAFSDIPAAGNPILEITWSTRNRLLEDGQVVKWDAGPVAPEYGQGTRITVRDQGGNVVYDEVGLWTELEKELTTSWFDRYSSITVTVSSKAFDLESLQNYSFQVTGLPANAGAPLPPVPPDHGPPPNVDPAPAVGAWSATGTQFILNQLGKVISAMPAILVSGTRDRRDAIGLIVRYKKTGTTDWFYVPEVALDDNPTQSATTSVAAQTTYSVEIAYRSEKNVLSMWRSLGDVTTGTLIAGGIGDLTYQQVKDALDVLALIDEEALEALGDFSEIISGINLNAEAILALAVRNVEDQDRFLKLTHQVGPGGEPIPIGTALRTETEFRVADGEAFSAIFTALGAWNGPDKTAWILNGMTTYVTPDMSFTSYLQAQISEFEGVYSTIQTTSETLASANLATATELHALGVGINGNTAFLIDQTKLMVTPTTSFAQYTAGLQSYVQQEAGAATANAVTQSKTYVDNNSAFAQVLQTVGVTTSGFSARITSLTEANTAFGARVGLRLDVNGHVTGFVANNNGVSGSFVFLTDYFIISTPGGLKQPFVTYPDGSIVMQDVRVTGNLLVDGTIEGSKIVGGAITDQLSFEAATNTTMPAAGVAQTDIVFNYVSSGGKHLVTAYGEIGATTSAATGCVVQLLCDGVVVGSCPIYCPGSWGGEGRSFPFSHTPGPGSHSYELRYTKTAGSGAGKINRSLVVITELKK